MTNLNTASIDDLKSLEGIGTQRATTIIKLRDENEYITMEDIKENLHNTASTIQKLLYEEKISLEIQPELVESIKERQDGEHKKARDNVAKEFDSKLNKVHEHYKTMQKNYEKEMNKMAIMMAELERKLSEKKSESLVTGDIVDKLAPHGIYGTKDNGHKSLKLEKNYTEAVASGGLTRSVSADSGLAKPGRTSSVTQTRTGKSNSTSGANGGLRQSGPFSSHIEAPPPPEMATFDGRSEWCPIKIQFDRIADRYKWSEDQRLERLIESLRDKALKFYCTCAKPVQNNNSDLCKKI